jgi:flavin-dependent dehydrogenase
MEILRVAVIGAGPGGLVTLKTLLEAATPDRAIEAYIFEAWVSLLSPNTSGQELGNFCNKYEQPNADGQG